MKSNTKILLGVLLIGIFVTAIVVSAISVNKNDVKVNTSVSSKILEKNDNSNLVSIETLNESGIQNIGKKGINFSVTSDKVLYYVVKRGIFKKYMLNKSEWECLMNLKKEKNISIDKMTIQDFVIKEIKYNYKNETAKIEAKVEK